MRHARVSWWLAPAAVLACTGALLTALRPGAWGSGIVIAVGLVTAWWMSPLRGTVGMPHDEAIHRARADGAVVVYWRPGFCARLRRGLGRYRRDALWVNIWADPDAAAFVRGVNNGNEVVPTVVIGDGEVLTNPDPQYVRAALLPDRSP